MNMTLEKKHIKNKEEYNNLEKLLEKKQENFIKNIFTKYDFIEKYNYVEKNKIYTDFFNEGIAIFSGILLFALGIMSIKISVFLFIFITFSAMMMLISSPHLSIVKKMNCKRWLRKKENEDLLANKIFMNSRVDKEVLQIFIETYGEKEFVDIMLGKEFLKYEELLNYIDNAKKIKEEKLILLETAKCLLQ